MESILVVDDAPDNLELLSDMLHARGYAVQAISSGLQALQAAMTEPPDLILLDVMMPGMDGYTVCQRLKANAATRDIPIIFLSALGSTTDKVKAFKVGGVDYITKPFQMPEVLARVRTHLNIRHLQRQLEAANQALNARLEDLDQANVALQKRNEELQEALDTIKSLSGLVPICAWCGRKIEDEEGNWIDIETYITKHSEAQFTHGICPHCLERLNRNK